jgi:hypothetical protein
MLALGVYFELSQRGLELQSPTTHVTEWLAFYSDASFDVNKLPGLVDTLFIDKDLTRKDHRVCPRPALGEATFQHQLIQPFFGHC